MTKNALPCYAVAKIKDGNFSIEHRLVDYDKNLAAKLFLERRFEGKEKRLQKCSFIRHKGMYKKSKIIFSYTFVNTNPTLDHTVIRHQYDRLQIYFFVKVREIYKSFSPQHETLRLLPSRDYLLLVC